MALMRSGQEAHIDDMGWMMRATDSVVLTRNLVDITTTAHVIQSIPDTLEYKYGSTILAWAVAPIPREAWPEKPIIQAGPEVGVLVYGMPRAGVPPGFVAEMYWNFHLAGVVIGSVLLGLGLRVLEDKFNPVNSRAPGLVLVYAVLSVPMGMTILGGTVGQGIFQGLVNASQALLILWLCRTDRGTASTTRVMGNPVQP
jgi:hypothetical protein